MSTVPTTDQIVPQGVQFPPAPFHIANDEEREGAMVTAMFLDGTKLTGALYRLDGSGRLGVVASPGDKRVAVPFTKLRYVLFPPLATPEGPHPIERYAADVFVSREPCEFEILYHDGNRVNGRAYGAISDELGLHVFRVNTAGEVARMFVPRVVIKDHRLGEPIGAALVRDKLITEAEVRRGLEIQQELRDRKLGDYLKTTAALTTDDLKAALDRQRSYSAQRIGELLLGEGLVTEQQLARALEQQNHDRSRRLGDILLEMGAVTAEALYLTLAKKLGVPFVKLQGLKLDPAILDLVTVELARKNAAMPLLMHNGRLVVALENPTGTEVINLLRFTTKLPIEVVAATGPDIQWAIDKYYGPKGSAEALEELNLADAGGEETAPAQQEVERLGKEKPVVKLVNSIIIDAIRRHASDIHIRAGESDVNLFFRVHGTLTKIATLSKKLLPAVVSRVKILCRLDIAERRLPQDGRTRVQSAGAVVDLRISIIPTVYGESVVIRILDTRVGLKSLDEIGFNDADREIFKGMLSRSNGLILVTGPTGSGKSTTLYAALREIRRQNVNIITVEDPVEYHVDGIEQIQANTTPGYDFARALRHILRHDPDVIMIGEIRDEETGKIAIESALTGHLVMSTLHTNDAAGTVTRLMEMGVQPYLLSATLLGVLAQRLARRNCPHCMAEETVDPSVRSALGVAPDEVFYRGAGCETCSHTGFGGRIAVYELLRATDALRRMIVPDVVVADLHRQAALDGMVPLTNQALELARQRAISLDEVYRVRLV